MKFRAAGTDVTTGEPIEMIFEAANVPAAMAAAQSRGITVESINPVHQQPTPSVPPPLNVHSRPADAHRPADPVEYALLAEKKPVVRGWAVIVVILAVIGSFISPTIGFSFSALLVLLIVLYLLPPTTALSRPVLGLARGRPVRTFFKLTFVAFLAFFMLMAGVSGQQLANDRQRREAEQKAEASRQEALRQQANARVDALVAEAQTLIGSKDFKAAAGRLSEALGVASATNKAHAQRLSDDLDLSSDPAAIRARLVAMPEADFNAFASMQTVPAGLDAVDPVVAARIVGVARPLVPQVKDDRIAHAKKQAEEAARQQAEEAARAEADRKEKARREAEAAAAREAAQKVVKDKVDAFLAAVAIDEIGAKLVDSVSASRDGDSWRATITVKNLWHIRNKQLRLQDAQNLWTLWASLTSPKNPDAARIKIVDMNNNEVGGSRLLGGSLIWVQD